MRLTLEEARGGRDRATKAGETHTVPCTSGGGLLLLLQPCSEGGGRGGRPMTHTHTDIILTFTQFKC